MPGKIPNGNRPKKPICSRYPRVPKRPVTLKTADDVVGVSFTCHKIHGRNSTIVLGGNNYGLVLEGRVRFSDGSRQRVAIKLFKDPLSDGMALRYRECLVDLKNAGVRFPKSDMVRIPSGRCPDGEWVMISQLFGSTHGGSKIVNKSQGLIRPNYSDPRAPRAVYDSGVAAAKAARIEAIVEFTKAANSEWFPAGDLIEPFKDISRGIIPIDIDVVARHGKCSAVVRAEKMILNIRVISLAGECPELFEVALQNAEPELRRELELRRPVR